MKITGIRTKQFEFQMSRRLGDANSPQGRIRASGLALFIDTDNELTGTSLASPADRSVIVSLSDLLIGKDPRGVHGLWKRMVDRVFKLGNAGIACSAISSLDVALWDLKAKANGEPLWKTLGAGSRRVKAYASGIDLPLTDSELRDFYSKMASKGISAGKLKVGLDRDADYRRVGIMRDALAVSGKEPELMIDSNEYWSAKQAIRTIRFFEREYNITWCEEPARRWDMDGLRKVSDSVTAAVASGENLNSIHEYVPLIANKAIDVVQVGARNSGITGAMQVAHLAYGFDLPVSMMNCPGNFMAHLAAALPNHSMMEVVDPGWETILRSDQRVEDGWIVLGDSPGHGLSFDEQALERFAAEQPSPESKPSPWGRRRGAGLYIVQPDEPHEIPGD